MGAFGYSDQEGARLSDWKTKLSEREIERRRKHLMQIQRRISKKRKKALVGPGIRSCCSKEISEESELLLEGRTAMHAPEIDGKVFVNDVPEGLQPVPANSIDARSPKPMITI